MSKKLASKPKKKPVTLELSEYHECEVGKIADGLAIDHASTIKMLIAEALESRSDIKRAKDKKWDY